MIGSGLQKWVVELLREQDSLSEYTLRYSLALFMNLCLRTAGEKLGTESSLCAMLDSSFVFIATRHLLSLCLQGSVPVFLLVQPL